MRAAAAAAWEVTVITAADVAVSAHTLSRPPAPGDIDDSVESLDQCHDSYRLRRARPATLQQPRPGVRGGVSSEVRVRFLLLLCGEKKRRTRSGTSNRQAAKESTPAHDGAHGAFRNDSASEI